TKPTKMPESKDIRIPQSAADLDSGPVIEILHEPASGVVTSAKDERVTQPTGKFAKEEVLEVKETKPRKDGSRTSGGADKAALSGDIGDKPRARLHPNERSGKHLTKE